MGRRRTRIYTTATTDDGGKWATEEKQKCFYIHCTKTDDDFDMNVFAVTATALLFAFNVQDLFYTIQARRKPNRVLYLYVL